MIGIQGGDLMTAPDSEKKCPGCGGTRLRVIIGNVFDTYYCRGCEFEWSSTREIKASTAAARN